jgi:hypothetical protein
MLRGIVSDLHLADLSDLDAEWWRKLPEFMSLGESKSLPLREIVGSAVGCGRHFNCDWTPKRWDAVFQRVYISMREDDKHEDQNPYASIRLFRVEGAYWVEHGHHRVSISKMLGFESVAARVWQDADGSRDS